VVRLARVGFDEVAGYLGKPVHAFLDHPELTERSSRLTAGELAQRLGEGMRLTVVDVRSPSEVEGGALPGALNIPLPRLVERLGEVDTSQPVVVYCQSGYRSMIASSVLRRAGAADVSDLLGGYEAWRLAGRQATPKQAQQA
jgi:hydroxyacylglutathione hydrolase